MRIQRQPRAVLSLAVTAILMIGYIAAVFALVVAGGSALLGRTTSPHVGLTFVGTAFAAVTLDPVRKWSGRRARRLVFGRRPAPPEVLAEFSERIVRDHAGDEVLDAMAEVVAEGTWAELAVIWLARGDVLEPATAHPHAELSAQSQLDTASARAGVVVGFDAAVAVTHHDELLGILAVRSRRRRLGPAELSVLDDLATLASTVLRNLRLQQDLQASVLELEQQSAALRASQRRIVEAQDAERRVLERDIHDGAQQYLTALGVKLGLASMLLRTDRKRALAVCEEIRMLVDDAESSMAELVRGIYPSLLAERGLIEAIRAQLPRFPFAIEIGGTVGSLPSELAAAVYFTCLGSLQNVAKHARASRADVRIDDRTDELVFEIADDGVGFDVSHVQKSGLQNMGDRIAALGGSLNVISESGQGTTILGTLPLSRRGE